MDALGTHLIIELSGCDQRILGDVEQIRGAMVMAAVEAGATIVGQSFHKFSPGGVTGIVALAESHLSIHTWPEHGYAAADIFTCGAALRPVRPPRCWSSASVPPAPLSGKLREARRARRRHPPPYERRRRTASVRGGGTTSR